MYLSEQLSDFCGSITKQQIDVVNNFLSLPDNWNEKKHGDKQQLGENISVVFLAATGSDEWKNVLEAHQKFYDLHYTLEGNDRVASKPVIDCRNIKSAYTEEGDYALYDEAPAKTIAVSEGCFCLIPPADAHMALYGDCGFVKKLVFKIPVAANAS
jgi:YhcH/YjgK/YiaL family protein